MKVFKFMENILSFLDIFSYNTFKKTTNKYLKYISPYVLLISQCTLSVSSAIFLMRSTEDLSDWMMALAQTVIVPALTAVFVCFALQMDNVAHLRDRLQNIVDDSKFF